jgi:metal-responsive CopG/Arc/MetJ family transcriptional regulator
MQVIMERTSFSLAGEELDEINAQLEYGDNRSAWIRDAVRLKLALLEEIGDLDEGMTDEERRELIVEAVRNEIGEE